ncbi:hypothetical protein V8C37DRAFT_419048 [Trichoderma ceciliae]
MDSQFSKDQSPNMELTNMQISNIVFDRMMIGNVAFGSLQLHNQDLNNMALNNIDLNNMGFDNMGSNNTESHNPVFGNMIFNNNCFYPNRPAPMPHFDARINEARRHGISPEVVSPMPNVYEDLGPPMGTFQPQSFQQGQQGRNGINSAFTPMPSPMPTGNTLGVYPNNINMDSFPGGMMPAIWPLAQSLGSAAPYGRSAMNMPMADTSNNPMNVGHVDFEAQRHPSNYFPPFMAGTIPAFPTDSLTVATATPTEPGQMIPAARGRTGGTCFTTGSFSRSTVAETGKAKSAKVIGTPKVGNEHDEDITDLLHAVCRKGARAARVDIFEKLKIEVQMTDTFMGMPLKPGEGHELLSHLSTLTNATLNPLFKLIDVTEEETKIRAKIEEARSAAFPPDSHARSGISHQEDPNQGKRNNSEAATPSRVVSTANRVQKRIIKPVRKRSSKPAQKDSKASSSKAKGKNEYTLTGKTRVLFDGSESVSYFCSDGQWRLLRDEVLEDAMKRTEALNATPGFQTDDIGSKRRNEVDDKSRAKRAKLAAEEITPPTTATESSSPDGPSPDTVPANGNQIVVEAQDTQPPLTVEGAKENYPSNILMLANAPKDTVIDVPPILPVVPVATETTTSAEEALLWLGSQMRNIQSSFD